MRFAGSRPPGDSAAMDLQRGQSGRGIAEKFKRQNRSLSAENKGMSTLQQIEERIGSLLVAEPYKIEARQHESTLLALLKDEMAYACERSRPFRNYMECWPMDYRLSSRVADLPFLPVGVFKINPPLALVERS